MAEPAPFSSPWAFLSALAKRLHTIPERLPSKTATEELIAWLETRTSAGAPVPTPFVQIAARLVYEQTRLALPPSQDDVFAVADRLRGENHGRPQAAKWQQRDWLKLARLVLDHRRLPTAAFFHGDAPTPEQLIQNVELPFAARYVEDPPAANARELIAPPLFALLERAEQLLLAIAEHIEEARSMLPDLQKAAAVVPRRPPGRSNSANPSQGFCASRSNSAK